MQDFPDEVLDFIVSLSWESSGFVSTVCHQLYSSVCRLCMSRHRPADIKCVFRSASCLDYALENRQMCRVIVDCQARVPQCIAPFSNVSKRLIMKCSPPDLVREVYAGTLGHVSSMFEMVQHGRVDLLSIDSDKDSFLAQALSSMRSTCPGGLPCSFELKCNLVLPACAAPSVDSLLLLETWARNASGGENHFDSTFSFSNTCCRWCVNSASSSPDARRILDFVVVRMARFDGVSIRVATAQVFSLLCSPGRTALSKSAWAWMRAKTSDLKETVDGAMQITRVARNHKNGWIWNPWLFMCRDVESYQELRSGIDGWLKGAFAQCNFGSYGLASHVILYWYKIRNASPRQPPSPTAVKMLCECAFDAFEEQILAGGLGLCLMKATRGLMQESAVAAYRVCESIATHNWASFADKAEWALYTSGLARDVLLRLASVKNDIAIERAVKYLQVENIPITDRERVLTMAVFRGDRRTITAAAKLVPNSPPLNSVMLATEQGAAHTFILLLELYSLRNNLEVGQLSLKSGYACIVQCALDFKCFVPGSKEERLAFGMLSVGDTLVPNKRKLPWASPETFEEGSARP